MTDDDNNLPLDDDHDDPLMDALGRAAVVEHLKGLAQREGMSVTILGARLRRPDGDTVTRSGLWIPLARADDEHRRRR